MWAIECQSLTKKFPRVLALNQLTLQIPEGAIYALMGPNGAGKTTLIKLLMNLIRPTTGNASLLGQSSTTLRGQRFEAIGYVSENQKLPDWMSIAEFIAYWRPFYPTWDRTLERELLTRFNLPPKQKLKHLSRGMRMKASLLSALAYHPRLIILDEPLSGLDPLVRDELMATLLETAKSATVLISSHDLAEIDSFSTHVGFLSSGQLRVSSTMEALHTRFRAIKINSTTPLPTIQPPHSIPQDWLHFKSTANTAEWFETNYSEESLRRIHQTFSPSSAQLQIESTPLSLRQIFLTLARNPEAITESIPSPSLLDNNSSEGAQA